MFDSARFSAGLADAKRLADLAATGIMDSPVEESFDRLTRLAARVIDAPLALASFVDDRRQFFKSRFGEIAEPWKSRRGSLLSHSFCQYVVERGTPLVVNDSQHHPLVCSNLAIEDLGVAAYAGVPIYAPSGNVLGSLCVIDSQERNWTDDELSTLVDLARNVDTEIALRLARERAEAANRAKSTFLANMSHELRTPLSAILGLSSILLKTRLDEQQQEYVEIVDSSGRDLLSMLDELLDLSRIEAGQVEMRVRPFRLDDILGGSMQGLLHRVREKGLEVSVAVAPEVPQRLLGDKARLRQMLVNLVGNAIKFTHEGEVSIRIGLAPDATPDAADSPAPPRSGSAESVRLRFEVEDTGIGIHSGVRRRIFEPFEQGDASISKRFGGAGLGLSIVMQLVSLMGGEVAVDSEPGRGSRFRMDLPLQIDHSAHTDGATAAEATEATKATAERDGELGRDLQSPADPLNGDSHAEMPSLRVLLVDDNSVNLLVGRRILEHEGHRVVTASGGRMAIELATRQRFDVILMDLQMPDLDGLAATRRLRESGGPATDTPIVALTAHAMDGDREACLAAGLDEFLTKPLVIDDLQRLLARIATDSDPMAEAEASSYESLLQSVGGDEDLLAEVAAIWRRQSEENLDALRRALEDQDHAELVRLSHKIGGTALVLGDLDLGDAARSLHDAAQSETDRAQIEQSCRHFVQAFHSLTRRLSPLAAETKESAQA